MNIQSAGFVREENVLSCRVVGAWWQNLTCQISVALAVRDDAKQAWRWIDFLSAFLLHLLSNFLSLPHVIVKAILDRTMEKILENQ